MATRLPSGTIPAPRPAVGRTITANNTLRSGYWSGDVTVIQGALARLTSGRPASGACRVSFFEVAGDADLHVNVTHRYETVGVTGWSGPAIMPDGFVHNRRFRDRQSILPHICAMVFAARV